MLIMAWRGFLRFTTLPRCDESRLRLYAIVLECELVSLGASIYSSPSARGRNDLDDVIPVAWCLAR